MCPIDQDLQVLHFFDWFEAIHPVPKLSQASWAQRDQQSVQQLGGLTLALKTRSIERLLVRYKDGTLGGSVRFADGVETDFVGQDVRNAFEVIVPDLLTPSLRRELFKPSLKVTPRTITLRAKQGRRSSIHYDLITTSLRDGIFDCLEIKCPHGNQIEAILRSASNGDLDAYGESLSELLLMTTMAVLERTKAYAEFNVIW